jgi:hypothetical protein
MNVMLTPRNIAGTLLAGCFPPTGIVAWISSATLCPPYAKKTVVSALKMPMMRSMGVRCTAAGL